MSFHRSSPRTRRKKHNSVHLLLVGDSSVGKSCCLSRFTSDSFNHNLVSTIGLDYKLKNISYKQDNYKLLLWDTAGQERFRTITPSFFRNAHGVMIVYDVTDRATFEHVDYWLHQIENHAKKELRIMIVGNKIDLPLSKRKGIYKERQVTIEEGKLLADSMGMLFYETSALKNVNINLAFNSLTNVVIEDALTMSTQSESGGERGGGGMNIVKVASNTPSLWKRLCC